MDSHSKLNNIYRNMKQRCYDTNNPNYKKYGKKGITICLEWLDKTVLHYEGNKGKTSKGFLAFKKWALSNGYTDSLTIDRIDSTKGYNPDNCRWVTQKVQQNNRTNNHLVTYKGRTQTLTQWCAELGISYDKTKARLIKCKWSVEKAFES